MMTSSNENIFRVTGHLCGEFTVTGEFPAQRPVTRSFDVFFDLHLNKRLSKKSWGWWFQTRSRPLWRHCNVNIVYVSVLYTVIGLDNGLSPDRHKAMIWTNASIMLITPFRKRQWHLNQNTIFLEENEYQNVVCKMAAILSRPECLIHSFQRSNRTDVK